MFLKRQDYFGTIQNHAKDVNPVGTLTNSMSFQLKIDRCIVQNKTMPKMFFQNMLKYGFLKHLFFQEK